MTLMAFIIYGAFRITLNFNDTRTRNTMQLRLYINFIMNLGFRCLQLFGILQVNWLQSCQILFLDYKFIA